MHCTCLHAVKEPLQVYLYVSIPLGVAPCINVYFYEEVKKSYYYYRVVDYVKILMKCTQILGDTPKKHQKFILHACNTQVPPLSLFYRFSSVIHHEVKAIAGSMCGSGSSSRPSGQPYSALELMSLSSLLLFETLGQPL